MPLGLRFLYVAQRIYDDPRSECMKQRFSLRAAGFGTEGLTQFSRRFRQYHKNSASLTTIDFSRAEYVDRGSRDWIGDRLEETC
jgi:hypothetical protein